ncbi:MAG: hypothetical protein ACTSW7_00690 [Candidatus Thorarchaeota archaeon]|nr:MAG: hypothetical protein DRQ25_15430 [Candidatus Fermentibacteria bacterium]HEC72581.1 hypothetical protein [Thermoplasmatales archaeon]
MKFQLFNRRRFNTIIGNVIGLLREHGYQKVYLHNGLEVRYSIRIFEICHRIDIGFFDRRNNYQTNVTVTTFIGEMKHVGVVFNCVESDKKIANVIVNIIEEGIGNKKDN